MLVQNLLDRGYADLVRPLTLKQLRAAGLPGRRTLGHQAVGFSGCVAAHVALATSLAGLFIFRDLAAPDCWAECRWCWQSAFSP